jgi:NAD(P)H dehydrogenase (quinone)
VNVLVVFTHPLPDSFLAAARDRVVSALQASGHTVDLLDLYADGFDPTLGDTEWRTQTDGGDPPAELSGHVERLHRAEAMVFVHPTWWSGPPSMLLGWFSRLFVAGVAYDVVDDQVRGRLTHVGRIAVVTAHGSSKLVNSIEGEVGKRLFKRQVRALCGRRTRVEWIAMYTIDRSTNTQRTAFLDRVQRRLSKW